jgi:hypothetical protein
MEKINESKVEFPCGSLSLEGILSLPKGKGPFPAAVVCHPHPLYGGDMRNGIVAAVCRTLAQQSIMALRFNFRGVGQSQGSYGGAIDEQEDVRAALSFISSLDGVDKARIGLGGYSFGAVVISGMSDLREQVQAIALICLPHPSSIKHKLKDYVKPKLIVGASEDDVAPAEELLRLAEELPEPKEYEVIAGADHFLGGYKHQVADKVASFLADALQPNRKG